MLPMITDRFMLDPACLDALSGTGFCKLSQFVSDSLTQAMLDEIQALDQRGLFHPAAIGRARQQTINRGIRGDRICWLEPQLPVAGRYLQGMEQLRGQLNREFFLGLTEFEAHYAIYPPGSFYRRHLDRHRDHPARTLSAVLYLNPDWPADGGGELVAELENGETLTIQPEAGKLVLFRSDTIFHEVKPTRQERMSLTGWFRTRL